MLELSDRKKYLITSVTESCQQIAQEDSASNLQVKAVAWQLRENKFPRHEVTGIHI